MKAAGVILTLAATALSVACGCSSNQPIEQGFGPNPQLPPPDESAIPVVHVPVATGWPSGTQPQAAPGLALTQFAGGLEHPRWVYVLPNGDVLVAESNRPPSAGDAKGVEGRAMKYLMKRAGAGVPSADRITLLRDADGDGVAETRSTFLSKLTSPFGMALVGDTLYVANADALVRVPYQAGAQSLQAKPVQVAPLPAGRNHHWTKSLVASKDGKKLYVGVGSNSNIADHGMAEEENRAAILEIDAATGATRVFAGGLRNPVGLAWEPKTGALWTSVNERDMLGNDLVPDYMTSVKDGGFYGWPWSYYGQNVDERVEPANPSMVAKALKPDYALGAHTASLGLAWSGGNTLGAGYAQGMFIGQHGSWNRRPASGYKVIFVPFRDGQPQGGPQDVLTGFLSDDGKARGRPVGVAIDARGGLLVADDVGNVIWRVSAAGGAQK